MVWVFFFLQKEQFLQCFGAVIVSSPAGSAALINVRAVIKGAAPLGLCPTSQANTFAARPVPPGASQARANSVKAQAWPVLVSLAGEPKKHKPGPCMIVKVFQASLLSRMGVSPSAAQAAQPGSKKVGVSNWCKLAPSM